MIKHCEICGKEFFKNYKYGSKGYYVRYNILGKKVCSNCKVCYTRNNSFERKISRYPPELRQKIYKKLNQISARIAYAKARERNQKQKAMSPEELLKSIGYFK